MAMRRLPFLSSQMRRGMLRQSYLLSNYRYLSASSSSPSVVGPMMRYQSFVDKAIIKDDPYQRQTMTILQNLYQDLLAYKPTKPTPQASSSSIFNFRSFSWLNDSSEAQQHPSTAPLGVYIYGGVGCGKTFMMDMFYEELPITRKLRSHFNTFMLDIHKRLHKLKSSNRKSSDESHIQKIADDILQESYVICFDEFQVTDIADALLLKSLFTILWEKGCVVVATSNRPPEELYKDGLQRVLFLPFIDTVLRHMQVVSMTPSPTDYRQLKHSTDHKQSSSLYITPFTPSNLSLFHTQFKALAHPDSAPIPLALSVYGHFCHIPQAILSVHYPPASSTHTVHHIHSLSHTHVASFDFKDICGGGTVTRVPLGASDYILLAASFSTVFISNVPQMSLQDRNELRRFITLIDALYEGRVLVCIHAESEVTQLLNITPEEKKSTPFDEVFAFDRTVSRLLEMQSQDYLTSQYSEWLQRRGSSKGLLASLLQSEHESPDYHSSPDDTLLAMQSEDEPFVPQFQIEALSIEQIREVFTALNQKKMVNISKAQIIRLAIEKRAHIHLLDPPTSTPLVSTEPIDTAIHTCHSNQGGLVFLSSDHSFRIATSSPSNKR